MRRNGGPDGQQRCVTQTGHVISPRDIMVFRVDIRSYANPNINPYSVWRAGLSG